MKDKAAEYARGGTMPTQAAAEAVVSRLMHEERIDPRPDKEVIEFYARELIALAEEASGEEEAV